MKLGKVCFTTPGQATTAFHKYVNQIITMLEDEQSPMLPPELQIFAKAQGHKGVKAITQALRDSGMLIIRELDTIPTPPEETE